MEFSTKIFTSRTRTRTVLTRLYRAYKWAVKLFTRSSGLHRLYNRRHSLFDLNAVLAISKVLKSQYNNLNSTNADVDTVISTIIHVKLNTSSYRIQNAFSRECKILYSIKRDLHLLQTTSKTAPTESDRWMLDEIWTALESTEKTRDWVRIGFQGRDPFTDFRATGLFGLVQLHGLSTRQTALARRILAESATQQSVDIWYPFALASIHISHLLLQQWDIFLPVLLQPGLASQKVQNLYSDLFLQFHSYWLQMVAAKRVITVLDFEGVFDSFRRVICT